MGQNKEAFVKKFSMFLAMVFGVCTAVFAVVLGPQDFKKTMTGTALALSNTSLAVRSITVCGGKNNTGTVYVGGAGVSGQGIELDAKDCVTVTRETNGNLWDMSKVYVNGTANDTVTGVYTSEYVN